MKKPLDNSAWIVGDVAYIDVSTQTIPRAIAIVDADDLGHVLDGRGRWRVNGSGYAYRQTARPRRRFVSLHRFVMGVGPEDLILVDHRNRDPLDNRRCNLRFATGTQNAANRPGLGKKTPFKGVFPLPDGRFLANIRIHGVTSFIGHFDTAEAAARAYDIKAARLFGEFAYLNFPQEVTA